MEAVTRARVSMVGSWWVSLVLALLGLTDALYLAWIKLANATAACSKIGDCELVNTSRYSEIGGIPIAALGAAAFFAILTLLAAERKFPQFTDTARVVVFGFALTGTLYSAYLTYVELAVLKAICPFCVASALMIAAILVLSVFRLRSWES